MFTTWYGLWQIKRFNKGTQLEKVLKPFKIVSDPTYDVYHRRLASMVYKFFDYKSASLNKSSGSGIANERNY